MSLRTCPREAEVKALVDRGQWPQACTTELRGHVNGCSSCKQLALITAAFQRARNQSVGAAPHGSPGLLWWRAQLRRRDAAMERISRPILSAQIFALVLNLVLAVAVAIWQAPHGLAWLTWLGQLPHDVGAQWITALVPAGMFAGNVDSPPSALFLIAAASAVAFVGCVIVYFASEKH